MKGHDSRTEQIGKGDAGDDTDPYPGRGNDGAQDGAYEPVTSGL